jgi:hypothetical protein
LKVIEKQVGGNYKEKWNNTRQHDVRNQVDDESVRNERRIGGVYNQVTIVRPHMDENNAHNQRESQRFNLEGGAMIYFHLLRTQKTGENPVIPTRSFNISHARRKEIPKF